MPQLQYQCRLARDGGLAADDVVNVFAFDTDQTVGEDADDIAGRLKTFYTAIQAQLASTLTGAMTIKAYNLADPSPGRVPVYSTTHTIAPGSTALPAELAMCVTLLADQPDTIPIRNRRGRVYIGPLSTGVVEAEIGTPSDVRLNPDRRLIVANAMVALAKGPDAGDGRLAVYSEVWHHGRGPTSGGGEGGPGPLPAVAAHSLADATNDVTRIQIDNAVDIQRRRGSKSTARVTYPIP